MVDKELYYSLMLLHKLFSVKPGKVGTSFSGSLRRLSGLWTVESTA